MPAKVNGLAARVVQVDAALSDAHSDSGLGRPLADDAKFDARAKTMTAKANRPA